MKKTTKMSQLPYLPKSRERSLEPEDPMERNPSRGRPFINLIGLLDPMLIKMTTVYFVFRILTLGGNVLVWGILALNFYWKGYQKEASSFLIVLIADFTLNKVLKYLFMSPRPGKIPYGQFGSPYGFPSSHAQTSFFVTSYLTIKTGREYLHYLFFLYIFSGVVAYSRVFLGFHYWYDVIGGAIIGFSSGLFFWEVKETFTENIQWTWKLLLFIGLLSLLVGYLLYRFFPLYPVLITGVVTPIAPSYGLTRMVGINITKVMKKIPSLKRLLMGDLSTSLFMFLGYPLFLRGWNVGVILCCLIGGIWTFCLFPLLYIDENRSLVHSRKAIKGGRNSFL